jgi:carboxylesterase
MIIETAEPFFFPGDPKKPGCLLVHGFTGTPKEMRWMGEYLVERGYTVLGIRLTGHATRPEDMIRSRYTDWLASVEDGYSLLRGAVQEIFLAGLSMGGTLSLTFAADFPVAGVIAMSTPYALPPDPRIRLTKILAPVVPYLAKTKTPGEGWFDKAAWESHVAYPKNPTRSIAELFPLLEEMRAALPRIRVPVLLMHSKDDTYVSPESMPKIYNSLGTEDKTMKWLSGGGHVITREPTKEEVFRESAAFIRRVSGEAS